MAGKSHNGASRAHHKGSYNKRGRASQPEQEMGFQTTVPHPFGIPQFINGYPPYYGYPPQYIPYQHPLPPKEWGTNMLNSASYNFVNHVPAPVAVLHPQAIHIHPNASSFNLPPKKPEVKNHMKIPSRSLLVRNIKYKIKADRVRKLFEKYGDVKECSDLIDARGIMLVTFFDIRHSERAFKDLNGYIFEGRKLDIHFYFPKSHCNEKETCTVESNQGTITFELSHPSESVKSTDVERLLSAHGQVRRFQDVGSQNFKKSVEFFDSRDAAKAFEGLHNSSFKGGTIRVSLSWDLPLSIRISQASVLEDPFAGVHNERSSHSRSSDAKKPDPPLFFEDRSPNVQPADPRRKRDTETVNEPARFGQPSNTPSSSNTALMEQMNNLLGILNQVKKPST